MNRANPVGYVYRSLKTLLTPAQKKRSAFIFLTASLISLADVVGLSAMVPVLMLAIDRSFLEKSSKLRWVFDTFGFETESAFLVFLIVLILSFFLLKNILALLFYRFTRNNAVSIVSRLSEIKYRNYFGHNPEGLHAAEQGNFQEKVLLTPYYFVSGVYLPFVNLVSESVVVASLVTVFTLYNPLIFLLIAGLLMPSFYLVNRYTRNRIYNLSERTNRFREKAAGILDFGLSGYIDIRLNRAHIRFFERFRPYKEGFIRNGIKAVNYQLIPARINELVALIGIILLVLYGYFISDNTSEVRVIAALLAFSIFRMIPAANRMLQAIMHMRMNQYTIALLQTKEVEKPIQVEAPTALGNGLRMEAIRFTYPENQLLIFDALDFSLPKGHAIGIKGASGAGKTTLLKILMGLEIAEAGRVMCNDVPLDNGADLGGICSYVSQEPFLFQGTLAENIALGLAPEQINRERVMDSLRRAAFSSGKPDSEWITLLVDDRGNNLSEGQKQRIALARALYFDRPLLILDEPTSALDSETELQVISTLRELKNSGKTILIIAHRDRVMDLCDHIYEIRNHKLEIIR